MSVRPVRSSAMTGQVGTYNNKRVCHAGDDIEFGFEHKRQVAEHSAEQVDGHERDGDPDDFVEFIYLVVLRTMQATWRRAIRQC